MSSSSPFCVKICKRLFVRSATNRLASPLAALYRVVVQPVATRETPGAWYRDWRVMSLDGTTLDVADTAANRQAFRRPASARGVNATGAFPQVRLVGLVETGTHVLCGAQLGAYTTEEVALAAAVVPALTPAMLCLADRGFVGFDLWQQAAATGAALLWRVKATLTLPVEARYANGSYRSALRWNSHCRSVDRTPIPVRVIDLARWHHAILSELRAEPVRSSRGRVVPRAVKRKISNYSLRPRRRHPTRSADYGVRIVK